MKIRDNPCKSVAKKIKMIIADIQVDKKSILLPEPIKTLGEVVVPIKVGYQMTSDITVTVVPLETEKE